MKKITYLYENCKMPLRVTLFGFILMAFGFLIRNENVNIFYTFSNTYLLMFADGCQMLGQTIVSNLPLIFMVYLVCKKANSGVPIILALIGYFSFLVTMTLYVPQNLSSYFYNSTSGINTIISLSGNGKLPLETGLIGSFVVGYITRFSYIRSRHRSSHSLLGFLNKDSAAIIYNIVFCVLAGMAFSYLGPILYSYLAKVIVYISKDLNDPARMLLYGFMDRVLSILGLGNSIKYPFWFTSLGGTYQTISGQNIVGDVNIWAYVKDSVTTYTGAGRFVAPYYVINMFMTPACYVGIFTSINDSDEKKHYIVPLIALILLSIICGSSIPLELFLLFTSPMLLLGFVFVAACVYAYLTYAGIYLGASISNYSSITALPGSFPDFIINIRSINHYDAIISILLVGVLAFLVVCLLTYFYYHHFAYNFVNTSKAEDEVKEIILKLGGIDNIISAKAGFMRINFALKDEELVSIEKLSELPIAKIYETKNGFSMELGSSSYIVSKMVSKSIKKDEVAIDK